MFLQVYFHRTRRILDVFLYRFMKDYLSGDKSTQGTFPTDIDQFLSLDDYSIWRSILSSKGNVWSENILNRHIWSVVHESPSHSRDTDKLVFHYLKADLSGLYSTEQCFIDHISKAPHKLPTVINPKDVKSILLVKDGKPVPISSESEVIKNVTAPIVKFRVYAHPGVFDCVKGICVKHVSEAQLAITV